MRQFPIIIALGSNRPHGRYGGPKEVVAAAIEALGRAGLSATDLSSTRTTPALGPAGRDFANAVLLSVTELRPPEIMRLLKRIEKEFGRRFGRRWGPRVLDLDLIAWGAEVWPSRTGWRGRAKLAVPHRSMHLRDFVLEPLVEIAPCWRHPVFGLTARQLLSRLRRGRARH